ncbi:hypothetical protein HOLleu_06073 [Holothuria leucospilota]|uniref:Uncharacterized protein n=1 Tax=Holothuria leucospilota TaxID=206669 RepID=A0A9Q1CMB2_HOLLE|nr:hypothetical protein HOLleu_06073 [Holothuria leucospilota]
MRIPHHRHPPVSPLIKDQSGHRRKAATIISISLLRQQDLIWTLFCPSKVNRKHT